MKNALIATALILVAASSIAYAQSGVDRDLLNDINKIKAIDNHAHRVKYVAAGQPADTEFDALPLDAIPPFPLPVRLFPNNPEFIRAWHDLYGYDHRDMSDAHLAELLKTKQRVLGERTDSFPAWILDQLNIETMFANRVAMGRGLTAPRFRWVSFDDALLFPLSNEAAKRANVDYKGFYPAEEKLLKRYMSDLNVRALPASLDLYLKQVVTPTLERQKKNGAVAIKYEAAYLRKLDFDNPDEAKARLTYARYVRGGEPLAADYKALQDFLFFYIAREAGRLGLAVHIHCIEGAGGFYRQTGSHPLLLETAFHDLSLRKTNFVVVHGGYPLSTALGSPISQANVYSAFSAHD